MNIFKYKRIIESADLDIAVGTHTTFLKGGGESINITTPYCMDYRAIDRKFLREHIRDYLPSSFLTVKSVGKKKSILMDGFALFEIPVVLSRSLIGETIYKMDWKLYDRYANELYKLPLPPESLRRELYEAECKVSLLQAYIGSFDLGPVVPSDPGMARKFYAERGLKFKINKGYFNFQG